MEKNYKLVLDFNNFFMPGGRPLKFQSVEELEEKINKYFKECDETIVRTVYNKDGDVIEEVTRPYTVTGLALALGTSRETLLEYEERPEFVDAIKAAKLKCQNNAVERALIGKANATFSIFNLKNNHGWKDKTEIEHSGNLSIGKVLDDLENGSKTEG